MSYRTNKDSIRPPIGRGYVAGRSIDIFLQNYEVGEKRKRELEKSQPDTQKRRDLQGLIADKILMNWPEEEIMNNIITNFNDISEERCEKFIQYWKDKKSQLDTSLEDLKTKKQNGELSEIDCRDTIDFLCRKYKFYRKYIKKYYNNIILSLGDDER